MNGEQFSAGQVITYVLLAIFGTGGAIASVWAVVKVIIPRLVDARLEGEKDTRQYSQKAESLEQLNRLSNSAAAHQVIAELLASSQENEQKANEFIRATVFNGIQEITKRLAQLETRQSLLSNLITGGKLAEDEEPTGDYDAWIRNKPSEKPTRPAEAGGDNE